MEPVVLEEKLPLHGYGVLRIAHGLVEINDAIEHLRCAYPLVQRAASVLVVSRIVIVALEWSNGSAKYIDALLVSLTDYLLVDVDDTPCCLYAVTSRAQVVDSLEKDDPLDALLAKQVALVAVHGSRSKTTAKNTVAANAHIEHTHLAGGLVGQQAAGEHVGPAVLLIGGRATAVGNRVAKNGHSSGLLGSLDLERQNVVPMVGCNGSAEVGGISCLQV